MLIKTKEAQLPASIELTPLIDMVFLLLIFFLAATTFHQTEREMQIALPVASSTEPISTMLREIIINVDTDGRIVVSGQSLEEARLGELIQEAVTANPEQKVTVRGDRRAAYAHIARVLDICKNRGIQEPYLDTVPTE
ncbi:MAG: biopolymer transporter ExbD [Phycisphaerales bacterium]|nr:MAG: biopolymer transporter ExbD [Phycisphaerales bacterium]